MNENRVIAPVPEHPVAAPAHAGGCPPDLSLAEPTIAAGESLESFVTAPTQTISQPHNQTHWFVMRSSYSRELKAKALLEKDHFTCYVPLRRERREKNGGVEERQIPVIHNLIFVQSSRAQLDPWKRLHEDDAALRYSIDKSTDQPMIVDDKSMEDFIRVTTEADESLLYLDNPEVVLTSGQPVEIIAGPFKGVRGHILRIRRDRRIVVSITNVVAVAMATMPREYFRILTED